VRFPEELPSSAEATTPASTSPSLSGCALNLGNLELLGLRNGLSLFQGQRPDQPPVVTTTSLDPGWPRDVWEGHDEEGWEEESCLAEVPSGYLAASAGLFPVYRQGQVPGVWNNTTKLGAFNSKEATLYFPRNTNLAEGLSLKVGGKPPILARTLLDTGANTNMVTRQFCEAHGLTWGPTDLVINTATGSSPVLGKVHDPVQVVLCFGTSLEARSWVELYVTEGTDPAIFEVLLGVNFLREHGVTMDPLLEILTYRPLWQSASDSNTLASLPIRVS